MDAAPAEELVECEEERQIGSSVRCGKLFKNAFLVHGVKHVCDNAMKEILPSMRLCLGLYCSFFPVLTVFPAAGAGAWSKTFCALRLCCEGCSRFQTLDCCWLVFALRT